MMRMVYIRAVGVKSRRRAGLSFTQDPAGRPLRFDELTEEQWKAIAVLSVASSAGSPEPMK